MGAELRKAWGVLESIKIHENAVKYVKIGSKRRGNKNLPVEFISDHGIWWKKKAIVYLMMCCTICNHHTRVIKSLSAIFKRPPVGGISSYVVAFILFSIKKA